MRWLRARQPSRIFPGVYARETLRLDQLPWLLGLLEHHRQPQLGQRPHLQRLALQLALALLGRLLVRLPNTLSVEVSVGRAAPPVRLGQLVKCSMTTTHSVFK